jgi:uncharacterized membrane protein YfcA
MTFYLVLVGAIAILAGAIASVSGFGIGSLLTPLLAVRVGTKLAVATVSIPHMAATGFRFWLMRKHVDWGLLLGFGLMSVTATVGNLIGTVVGERLIRQVPEPIYRKVVAALVLALGVFMLFRIGQQRTSGRGLRNRAAQPVAGRLLSSSCPGIRRIPMAWMPSNVIADGSNSRRPRPACWRCWAATRQTR